MSDFNKYDFLQDLQIAIEQSDGGDVWDLIHQEVDNECIYTHDCFKIVQECNYTDWSDCEFGHLTNIHQVAFSALYDFVVDNLEIPA